MGPPARRGHERVRPLVDDTYPGQPLFTLRGTVPERPARTIRQQASGAIRWATPLAFGGGLGLAQSW